MTVRDNLVEVADGDQLNDGYFNDIGEFYVEATDSSVADHTSTSASWALKRTFTFTSFSTAWCIKSLELEDLSLYLSAATGGDDGAVLGVEVSDGTTVRSYQAPINQPGGTDETRELPFWTTVTEGSPNTLWISQSTSAWNPKRNIMLPFPPSLMTGVTSWTVKIYLLNTAGAGSTATLENTFKVRLRIDKQIRATGGSATQS